MHEEQLKEGTSVFATDGDELGEITRFVIDPDTNEVTHIVIGGGLFTEDKVVPFDKVRFTDEEGLVLSEEIQEYDDLPPFEESYYVEASDRFAGRGVEDYPPNPTGPTYYWYPPHGYLGYPAYGLATHAWPYALTQQNIPEGTVPIQEGTDVIASDGEHVGDVERLLVDDETHQVTHFLVSQGLLFKDRKLVPANWIRTVMDDKVQLNVSSGVLEGLPAYEED
jgi:sporulation protein YlmC with PRC-barrel domain